MKCNFQQFLTMLIKLTNSSINDPESNKLQMIMNTDSTATLRFIKKLTVGKDQSNNKLKQQEDPEDSIDFKDLDQLTLKMDMGPMETITTSVAVPASLRRTASSTEISSNGFIDILTLARSTPVWSGFTRTFTL